MSKRMFGWVLAASAVGMVGCVAGGDPDVGGSSESLLDGARAPLEQIDDERWSEASDGCEGLLEGRNLRFALASAEDHLVAAIDGDGRIVCVDTVEAVEEELEESGRSEDAEELVDAFHATLLAVRARGTRDARFDPRQHPGDPDPEPNLDPSRMRFFGDPDPEPNCGG